jgi:hypothetical protein
MKSRGKAKFKTGTDRKLRRLLIVTGIVGAIFLTGCTAAVVKAVTKVDPDRIENCFTDQYSILYGDERNPELVDAKVKELANNIRDSMEATYETKSIENYIYNATSQVCQYMEYNDEALDEDKNVIPGYDDSLTSLIELGNLTGQAKGTCSQYTKLLCRVLAELGIDSEYCGGMVNAEPEQIAAAERKKAEEEGTDGGSEKSKPVTRWKHAWARVDLNQGTGAEPHYRYVDPTRYDNIHRDTYTHMDLEDYFTTWYEMNVFQ